MNSLSLRIAFYVPELDPSSGGIERVTYALSKEFASRGYELYAIYINKLPEDKTLYSQYKSLCQGCALNPEDIPNFVRFIRDNNVKIVINQIAQCHSSVMLQKAVKEQTSAILINVLHTTPSLLEPIKEFHRKLPFPEFINRTLFSIHKAINLRPKYRKGARQSYEMCDAFVLLSAQYFSEFAKENGIADMHKISAISNPFEPQHGKVPASKEKIVLVVARLDNKHKRVDRTLRFWKAFHKVGDGWKLIIVGDGDDLDMLKRMAEDLGLTDYSFEGHSSNPMSYYQRAEIFMMTSDVEGFGMTLIEAMSVGCVPIAMNCYSALPDIVTDRQNGMIVQKDDIQGMVNAAEYVISHFEEMSACAVESVKRFDVKVIADKWEELFNKLLK